MAIIYSYPTVNPERTDLILGTDVSTSNKATKNFTVQSIIDLVTVATGDLQTVLDLGNVATGRDINLTDNSFRGASFITTTGGVISGTTATGFTNITSTAFTGTLATAAQPNVTSLGTLSALAIGGPISGTGLITNSNLTGAQNDNVVSTLAIKTYVDNKVGLFDTLSEVLANGNTTGATKIEVDNTSSGIDFIDDAKLRLGTGNDFEIYHAAADNKTYLKEAGAGDLEIWSNKVAIKNAAGNEALLNATENAAVELYFDNAKKFETLTGGAKVTGAFQATTSGTFASLINTGTYSDSSGDVGTAGQILSSTGSGTNWVTEVPLYNWSLEGTAIPSGTAVTVTDGTNITTTWDATNFDLTIATTGVPDGSGAANQVTYWSDTDTLTGAAGFTFAGGATGKVAIAGELEVGGVLTDGAFTGSAGTYTGYVSITSTDFVGALTGNASTATALATSGAIALTGDTTSTGGPYTYTSGGAISIATTIADTTVTGKVLTNLPTPTSAAIAASDTILAAMAKLQGQITGIPQGLVYKGTWNASTNTPTLASGTGVTGEFYIVSVAGTTNLDGITDWQVGDWAIFVEVGATDTWQKIDNTSAILGSGTANKIAKWTGSNTLATGLIADDGTTVTVGNSGNLVVEGNTTLGDADTDSTTVKGPAVFEETSRFNVGISLGATTYGTAGQVLTSGGGAASVNTWTTPTTGTVTSVALTETGDALTITGSPVTSSGTINIAGAGSASQYINGALDLVTFPTVDNYVSWTADSDEGTDITVTSGFNLKFTGAVTAGGAGIATDSAVSANEMTIGLINAGGTPGATTFYRGDGQWSVPVGTKTETLAEVLVNGNTTGGTDIAVGAGDDITFTDSSRAKFGASSDLQIYHDGTNSWIRDDGTGDFFFTSNGNGFYFQSETGENLATFLKDSTVKLYYDNVQKFQTTSTGIEVSGTSSSFASNVTIPGAISAGANGGLRIHSSGTKFFNVTAANAARTNIMDIGAPDARFKSLYLGTDADIQGNVQIDGNLTVDGNIIHGSGGGIFNGDQAITTAGGATLAFTLTRATTGTMVFDVWLTSETSTGSSVAKKYTF